ASTPTRVVRCNSRREVASCGMARWRMPFVPDDEIADTPVMTQDETWPGGPHEQTVEQCTALALEQRLAFVGDSAVDELTTGDLLISTPMSVEIGVTVTVTGSCPSTLLGDRPRARARTS